MAMVCGIGLLTPLDVPRDEGTHTDPPPRARYLPYLLLASSQ